MKVDERCDCWTQRGIKIVQAKIVVIITTDSATTNTVLSPEWLLLHTVVRASYPQDKPLIMAEERKQLWTYALVTVILPCQLCGLSPSRWADNKSSWYNTSLHIKKYVVCHHKNVYKSYNSVVPMRRASSHPLLCLFLSSSQWPNFHQINGSVHTPPLKPHTSQPWPRRSRPLRTFVMMPHLPTLPHHALYCFTRFHPIFTIIEHTTGRRGVLVRIEKWQALALIRFVGSGLINCNELLETTNRLWLPYKRNQ